MPRRTKRARAHEREMLACFDQPHTAFDFAGSVAQYASCSRRGGTVSEGEREGES